MIEKIYGVVNWIRQDYSSNRIRFCLESLAWILSIGCAITMAFTVPAPPFMVLYPVWILGCVIYAGCSYHRGSFGMLANYLFMVTIDSVALARLLGQ